MQNDEDGLLCGGCGNNRWVRLVLGVGSSSCFIRRGSQVDIFWWEAPKAVRVRSARLATRFRDAAWRVGCPVTEVASPHCSASIQALVWRFSRRGVRRRVDVMTAGEGLSVADYQ